MSRGVHSGMGVDRRTLRRVGHRNGGLVRSPKTASPFSIVRALTALRVASGVTRNELADRSGYHEQIIGRYERGETTPSLRALTDLAQALGAEIDLRKPE